MNPIQFKRSCEAGAQPAPCELAEGEIAINLADGTMFSKDCDGNIVVIGTPASDAQVDGGNF